MKHIISFLLSCVMILLLLASCGGGADQTTADDGIYTVTFSVDGEKTTVEVPAGEIPEYAGKTSWETEEHFYKITGWDKEIVPATSDVTYTAVIGEYGLTVYDVRFNLKTGIVKVPTHEGETPTPPKGYETDLTRVETIGAFDHWTPALEAPTAENMEGKKFVMYTPVYNYSTRYYTVTFAIGENEYKVEAAGKSIPECPVDPADAVKDDFTLRFAGWDKEVVAVQENTTYTAVFASAATILPAKDGAKGVLTMTYDDGILATAKWVTKENKKYGLNGSCMMVPNWEGSNPNYRNHKGDWISVFADGTLEPENHSMSHVILPYEGGSHWNDSTMLNCYQENYDYELVQSKTMIENDFGRPVLCFAPSNNTLSHQSLKSDGNGNLVKDSSGKYIIVRDGGADKIACDTYYAIRRGDRTSVQTLDPTLDDVGGGWYNLAIKAFKDYGTEAEKVTKSKSWIDSAIANRTWLIVMCHGIVGDGASGSGDITTDSADQFFAYAGRFVEQGDLWCATFGEATKYIRERQNTTVSERYEDGKIYVEMTINRTAGDGKILTESIFNYPLTVEVRVPDDWHTVSYRSSGTNLTADVYVRDGASYAMVNVVPGADGANTITAVNRVN
ncbi:MAG: polysaccharide deacetylase family protein [Clostridia bacterium]|nr:polysaccharide deacetylase family protein [Clostridia bacterium]